MQNKITLRLVHKGVQHDLATKLYLVFSLTGIGFILLFVFIANPFAHPEYQWLTIPFAVCALVLVLSIPIAYIVARNSKKLQRAYIQTKIEDRRHLAAFYRSRVKDFSVRLLEESEKVFKEINNTFDGNLEKLDTMLLNSEKELEHVVEKLRQEEQKELMQAKSGQERKEIKKRWQECIDFTASFIQKESEKIIQQAKEEFSDHSATSIEEAVDARESMILRYERDSEKNAQQSESDAVEWETFLHENFD